MSEDEHRQASLTLRAIVGAFDLPPEWPVEIRKAEGALVIPAGEVVRRIEKRYPQVI